MLIYAISPNRLLSRENPPCRGNNYKVRITAIFPPLFIVQFFQAFLDGNARGAKMIGRTVFALLVSFFLLCVGIGSVVLVYLWLVWYASLHGFFQRREGEPDKAPKQGLSQADIQKLPTVESSAGAAEAECAVCLDSFQAGEQCRLIPACNHRFHVYCVDAWLSKRSVCPICRAGVLQAGHESGLPAPDCGPAEGGISADAVVDVPAAAGSPRGFGAAADCGA